MEGGAADVSRDAPMSLVPVFFDAAISVGIAANVVNVAVCGIRVAAELLTRELAPRRMGDVLGLLLLHATQALGR